VPIFSTTNEQKKSAVSKIEKVKQTKMLLNTKHNTIYAIIA